MTKLRSKIAKIFPKAFKPFAKRQLRVLDQMRGQHAARNRPGVVLMLHVGRCGSTVLANLLSQNAQVYWDGKLPRKAHQLYGEDARNLDVASWTRDQFDISGDRYYGFEFKILDDQYPAMIGTTTQSFLDICKEIGVTHYVLLSRRNTLRHVVSHYASRHRGNWHASSPGDVKKKEFTLDLSDVTTGSAPGRDLVSYMREVDAAHALVKTALADQPLLEVEYEGDIDEKGAEHAYRKICGFLDVEPGTVEIKNMKLNPHPIKNVVENFEALTDTLEGTEYAWMAKD